MIRPQWLTARCIAGVVLVQLLIFGLVGVGLFLHFGGLGPAGDDSDGYVELLNHGDRPETITVYVVDVTSDERIFELNVALGTNGEDGHYSSSWPPMTSGEKRLTVVVDENRTDAYEFDAGEGGTGPNLSIAITEDGVEFDLVSGVM